MEEGDSSLLPKGFDAQKADCLILSVALKYKAEDKNPILLTSDNLLQSKALGLGIKTYHCKIFFRKEGNTHKSTMTLQVFFIEITIVIVDYAIPR